MLIKNTMILKKGLEEAEMLKERCAQCPCYCTMSILTANITSYTIVYVVEYVNASQVNGCIVYSVSNIQSPQKKKKDKESRSSITCT